ncbi:hypothetical protein OOZ19_21500 [Saccharopolyspora sp. NFXS83]|uniref:hypothetical protein n=1 Tax=Saccharopolyspora sp. NFXS83 TaxID=2993560 RepID=UPI00224B329A|nr:hypothetical protein [Saccharopolyspora sp. NFXS83]MCX2732822.1 hypothetical protein [Saccharopolyspora sp. NFXS83]
MRFRKSISALVLCAAGAGASLLGAGTALADVDKEYGPYDSADKCAEAGVEHRGDEGIVGYQCEERSDGFYLIATYR